MTANELYSRSGLYRWETIPVDDSLIFYRNSGEPYSKDSSTPLYTLQDIKRHTSADKTLLRMGDYLPKEFVLQECSRLTSKYTSNGFININGTKNNNPNTPTNTTFKWLPGLAEDEFIISLSKDLKIEDLAFQFDTEGIETIIQPFSLYYYRNTEEKNDLNYPYINNLDKTLNADKPRLYYVRIKLNKGTKIKNKRFNLNIKDSVYNYQYANVNFIMEDNHSTNSITPWNYPISNYYRHSLYGNGYSGVIGLDKTLRINKTNNEDIIINNTNGYNVLNIGRTPDISAKGYSFDIKAKVKEDGLEAADTAIYHPVILDKLLHPNSNGNTFTITNTTNNPRSNGVATTNMKFSALLNKGNIKTGEGLIWLEPVITNKNNAKAGKNVYLPFNYSSLTNTLVASSNANKDNFYIPSTETSLPSYNINNMTNISGNNPYNDNLDENLTANKYVINRGEVITVSTDINYSPSMPLAVTMHPSTLEDANTINYRWDNQTDDVIKVMPYIFNGYVCAKVLPYDIIDRTAVVGLQGHLAPGNDNDKYKQGEYQFVVNGTNRATPIDLDKYDIRLRAGESDTIRVFSIAPDNINFTMDQNLLSETNKEKDDFDIVTYTFKATSPGDSTIRFSSITDGYITGNVTANVKVYGVPPQSEAKLEMNVDDITGKGLTKKRIMVAVGESKNIPITANRCDNLVISGNNEAVAGVNDLTTHYPYEYRREGSIQVIGRKVGSTVSTIKSVVMYNDGKMYTQKTITLEIIVIPKDTWDISADLGGKNKIKIDVKKNNKPNKWFNLQAVTNANYLVIDVPFQPSFFVINKQDFYKYNIDDIKKAKFELEMGYSKKGWKANKNYNITNKDQIPTLNQLVFASEPNYDNLDLLIGPKLTRGKYIMYIHALTPRPCTIRKTIEVEIKVTNNIEVPKDEIWVAMQHKQPGIRDNDEDYDYHYYSVIKWLARKDLDSVYNHRINMPRKSGRLLTHEEFEINSKYTKRYFNYMEPGLPNNKVNPEHADSVWLDTTTGESWTCKDITPDDNVWISNTGKMIGRVEKLDYPKPGEIGFGVGPMSYDKHIAYGLTPLEGCYDRTSPNYGNYKDRYGNIYVCIPKHYVKISK